MGRPESDERKVAQALAKRRAEGWLEVIDGDAQVTVGLRETGRQGGTTICPMRSLKRTLDAISHRPAQYKGSMLASEAHAA